MRSRVAPGPTCSFNFQQCRSGGLTPSITIFIMRMFRKIVLVQTRTYYSIGRQAAQPNLTMEEAFTSHIYAWYLRDQQSPWHCFLSPRKYILDGPISLDTQSYIIKRERKLTAGNAYTNQALSTCLNFKLLSKLIVIFRYKGQLFILLSCLALPAKATILHREERSTRIFVLLCFWSHWKSSKYYR